MRVLLVEDDDMIGKSIQQGLRKDGYTVDWVTDGLSAELALADNSYDFLLLDLGLPGKGGMDVLRSLRAKGHDIPVLIITAHDALSDRLDGLDNGADDYLVKPFDLDELSARMRAILRRFASRSIGIFEHGRLSLNPATHTVIFDGENVVLSRREFALLHLLVLKPDIILSRAQLEEKLYGWNEEVGSNAVEVHIHALRKKLGQGFIRNIRGVGYKIGNPP
jgi:two-component system response regulator QseB